MIQQTKEEIVEAIKEDPETWADLFLTLADQLAKYEQLLEWTLKPEKAKHNNESNPND